MILETIWIAVQYVLEISLNKTEREGKKEKEEGRDNE